MKAPPAVMRRSGELADGIDGAADRTQWPLAHCATETGFGLEEVGKTAEAEKYYRLTGSNPMTSYISLTSDIHHGCA